MRFARPEILWWLLLLAPLAGATALALYRRRRALERFAGGPDRRARFLGEVSRHRRAAKVLLWFLAVGATVVAAARPQWGTRLEPITQRGVDVAVVIDTSLSMAAEDVPPDRLGEAVHSAASLLTRIAGNRVGLITFAGAATLMCPLTLDHAAAKLFLDAVDVEAVPVPGTSMAQALETAIRALSEAGSDSAERGRVIVLFTDGEDHEGELDEATRALKEAHVAVFAVGCGTTRGAPIPLKDASGRIEGYKKDREDRVVTTRLDEAALEKLALETGGRYYRSTASGVEIEEIAQALSEMEAREFGTVMRVRFEERFQYPLGVALAALAAEGLLLDRRRRGKRALRAEEART